MDKAATTSPAAVGPRELDTVSRRAAAIRIAREMLRRWDRGEPTSDAGMLAGHPELMPELREEIGNARTLRRAMLAARKVGPSAEAPVQVLSDEEINAPLLLPSEEDSPPTAGTGWESTRVPRIPGCVLVATVSSGGQATVYRATQESTGRTVAAKVLSGGSLSDSRHRARFDREAEILANLRHPHIVDILDRGRTPDGDFYLLMGFVDGCELDEWWTTRIRSGSEGAQHLLKQFAKICRAVDAAHARGIVHRDLKPSNIRVDTMDEPRVLDFGMARDLSGWNGSSASSLNRAVTVSGQLLGSIPWASPEQASGGSDRLDARSDVYALGVMLYQALTGRFPYRVDGPLYEVLDNIACARVSPPSSIAASRQFGQRRALDAVVLRALSKDPGARYVSAGAFADDLDRLLAGRLPGVKPVRPRRGWRRVAFVSVPLCASVAALSLGLPGQSPTAPTVFALPGVVNSAGMRMVLLPGGTFAMGSAERERGRQPSETLRFEAVESFFIGATEVTQRQFEKVMGRLPARQKWYGPDIPVHNVSWDDANAFCRRLSEAEKKTYRLPTEVEWEYACRAGSTTAFFTSHGATYVAWHQDNSGGRLHRVSEKWANPWGIFDIHGNVQEWCDSPLKRPSTDVPAAAARPAGLDLRVLRGGGIMTSEAGCRAAARAAMSPSGRLPDVGFRVALDSD